MLLSNADGEVAAEGLLRIPSQRDQVLTNAEYLTAYRCFRTN